jgi:DNA-binding NarL/FixJ family response regulator
MTSIATKTGGIRVLVVDDHFAVRLGVRQLIDDQRDMRVVAQARDVEEALGKLGARIDVAIVDYHLGAGRDGLWLTAHLKRRPVAPRVLIYSAFADPALAVAALIAGADGLLGKHELGDELCEAIRRVARGRQYLPAIVPAVARAMGARLGPQDRAIFGMLLHGLPSGTIAERLMITDEDMALRRAKMVGSLTRSHEGAVPLPLGTGPLDYERPKRRVDLSVRGNGRDAEPELRTPAR